MVSPHLSIYPFILLFPDPIPSYSIHPISFSFSISTPLLPNPHLHPNLGGNIRRGKPHYLLSSPKKYMICELDLDLQSPNLCAECKEIFAKFDKGSWVVLDGGG